MLKFSILNLWFQQVYGSVSTRWSCCRNVSNSASLAANMDCSSAAVGNVCWLSEVDMVGVKGCLDELNDGNQSWVEWVMEAIELKMKGMIYFCDRDRRCNSTARESRRRLFTACVCVCVCVWGRRGNKGQSRKYALHASGEMENLDLEARELQTASNNYYHSHEYLFITIGMKIIFTTMWFSHDVSLRWNLYSYTCSSLRVVVCVMMMMSHDSTIKRPVTSIRRLRPCEKHLLNTIKTESPTINK